jgi:hypothetical protein
MGGSKAVETPPRTGRPSYAPRRSPGPTTRLARIVYGGAYLAVVLLFGLCALALIAFACAAVWRGVDPGSTAEVTTRLRSLLEGFGLLTISVASLELSQTVLEEEVQREASMSTPTRARRVLSRFMLVVVIALAVEFLVLVFELIHGDRDHLPHAAAIGLGAAALLVAWGAFIRMNAVAENLEPEAMAEVKREDGEVA